MEINTIYNIGDRVFVMNNNKIVECVIKSIYIRIYDHFTMEDTNTKIEYDLKPLNKDIKLAPYSTFTPFSVFSTKEALIKTL